MFFRIEFLLWRRVGDEAMEKVKNKKRKSLPVWVKNSKQLAVFSRQSLSEK
jgi:hypothetical protein